jgi:hypothetical protein
VSQAKRAVKQYKKIRHRTYELEHLDLKQKDLLNVNREHLGALSCYCNALNYRILNKDSVESWRGSIKNYERQHIQ